MSTLAPFYFTPARFRNSLDWTDLKVQDYLRLAVFHLDKKFEQFFTIERNLFPTYFSLKSRVKDRQVDAQYFFSKYPPFDGETGETDRTVYGSIEIDVPPAFVRNLRAK